MRQRPTYDELEQKVRAPETELTLRKRAEQTDPDALDGGMAAVTPEPTGPGSAKRARVRELLRVQRDLATVLSAITDLSEALNRILEAAFEIGEVDSGGVYLIDQSTGEFHLAVQKGLPAEFVERVSRYAADSPQAHLVAAGNPIYSTYAEIAERQPDSTLDREGLRAVAVIPVQHQGKAVATLNLASHGHDAFRPWTREAAEAIAAQIGGVINRIGAESGLRQSEENLRRLSELNYRELFSAEPDAIIIVDLETRRIVDANPSVSEIYGYSHEELCSMEAVALSAEPDESKTHIDAIADEAAGGPNAPVGYRRHRKNDGTVFPVEIAHGFYVREGRRMICAMIRDVTEREQATQQLRESEERFREMAENIREVFWLFDWTGRKVIYASPAFETIWGRSVTSLYEDYAEWTESIHPDDREQARDSFRKLGETGDGEPREYRIVGPDGEVRWISDRGFAVRDGAGRVVRIAGVAEDVTERKRREEERHRLDAKIQQSQKLESLGVLTGGIAHDFNNLLMAILGNTDLALLRLAPESPGRDFVRNIEKATLRAADLTNQMLAYSGQGQLVVEPVQLNRLVEEMAHLLRTVISKKAALHFDFAEDLPAIQADASQIGQVVMNLITNAAEALGERNGTIRLSTGVVDADRTYLAGSFFGDEIVEGRYVHLEISDTGQGMNEETRQKIFDPFFTTKFIGRGLGLAAVLGIVRGHGGSIKVDSEPGRGSTFKILLPASDAAVAEERHEPAAPGGAAEGVTILVVDDDLQVLSVVKPMLEHNGFRALTAADGRDGVRVFRQHQDEIALVLLDMTMPHMDGEEAFREIKRIRPDARVVLSSGYSEEDATCRLAGRDLAGFIQKPYRRAALFEKIREVLGR